MGRLLARRLAIVLFQAACHRGNGEGGLQIGAEGSDLGRPVARPRKRQVTAQCFSRRLVAVIPAFVNSLLSCFMDTSLVTRGVDVRPLRTCLALGTRSGAAYFVELRLRDAHHFVSSFIISRYSLWLEAQLTRQEEPPPHGRLRRLYTESDHGLSRTSSASAPPAEVTRATALWAASLRREPSEGLPRQRRRQGRR